MNPQVPTATVHLFQPRETYRMRAGGGGGGGGAASAVGQNPQAGVVISYVLKDVPADGVLARRARQERQDDQDVPQPREPGGRRRRRAARVPRGAAIAVDRAGAARSEPLRVGPAISRRVTAAAGHQPVRRECPRAPSGARLVSGAVDRRRQDADAAVRNQEGSADLHHAGGVREAVRPADADSRESDRGARRDCSDHRRARRSARGGRPRRA